MFGRDKPLFLALDYGFYPVFEGLILNNMSFSKRGEAPLTKAEVIIFGDEEVGGVDFIVEDFAFPTLHKLTIVSNHPDQLFASIDEKFLVILFWFKSVEFGIHVDSFCLEKQIFDGSYRWTDQCMGIIAVLSPDASDLHLDCLQLPIQDLLSFVFVKFESKGRFTIDNHHLYIIDLVVKKVNFFLF